MSEPLTPEEEADWRAQVNIPNKGSWSDDDVARLLATLDAARVAPSDGLRTVGDLSAQVSAILFGAVDDETFERVMGAIRRTEAFADLDLYRALQPSWHGALMTYDPPDPIPAGGWSRLMPHTDEAIRIFTALRAALATTEQPTEKPAYLVGSAWPGQPEATTGQREGLDVETLAKALELVDDEQLLPSLHADTVAAEYERLREADR
jgi:hypothetical protein